MAFRRGEGPAKDTRADRARFGHHDCFAERGSAETGDREISRAPGSHPRHPACRFGTIPAGGGGAWSSPYFLYAGTLEPRKNIEVLLSAWREVRRSYAVDLVLAGRRRPDFTQLSPEPGLHIIGEVSDERLAELFAGTLAFVYPSLYEGFGLPVLEAMQCGACVITSRDPAIAEVAAGAAIEAGTHVELVQAMLDIAACPERAQFWRERGLRRAADFSWRRTAQLTYEVYEEAQRRF